MPETENTPPPQTDAEKVASLQKEVELLKQQLRVAVAQLEKVEQLYNKLADRHPYCGRP